MSAVRKLKPEAAEIIGETRDVVDDLYLVANLLEDAGRKKLSQEAAELASKIAAFMEKLKGELR